MCDRGRRFERRRSPDSKSAAIRPRGACMRFTLIALGGIVACAPPAPPDNDTRQEGGAMAEPTPIEHIVPEGVARLPVFTPAVRVGDLVFLSGAIGTPASGELRVVEGGVGPETRATMENIRRVLDATGLGFRGPGQVHGLPRRHRRLRGHERGVRHLLRGHGTAGAIGYGGERVGARSQGGDRVYCEREVAPGELSP